MLEGVTVSLLQWETFNRKGEQKGRRFLHDRSSSVSFLEETNQLGEAS